MQKLMKSGAVLALVAFLGSMEAHAVNTFGVDLSTIITDLTAVGTVVVGLLIVYLGYRFVVRMIGGK